MSLLLTCEHGGNRVPAAFGRELAGATRLLQSHRGYDIGALEVARYMAKALNAPLVSATVTRLLVDLNRSAHHPRVLSSLLEARTREEKREILARYHRPHRERIERAIAREARAGQTVWHLAVHSFTPRLGKQVRRADLGLLYDPARPGERALAMAWQQRLRLHAPQRTVRRNYPYRGTADGLTTHLRRLFEANAYVGLEVELSQRHLRTAAGCCTMARWLTETLPCAASDLSGVERHDAPPQD